MKKINKLFLGDNSSYLASIAKKNDANSILLDKNNLKNLEQLLLTTNSFYTSLADLHHFSNLLKVLSQTKKIYYHKPDCWSDSIEGSSDQENLTEFALRYFQQDIDVENYTYPVSDLSHYLCLTEHRKTENKQLWISGCSFAHGVGLEKKQRFGEILANELNLPVSFLTASGASIEWCCDQICRSDLKKNDILIFALTFDERYPYFKEQKVTHVTAGFLSRTPEFLDVMPIDYLDCEHRFYKNYTCIMQVVNFCRKIGVHLIVFDVADHEEKRMFALNHLPEYYAFYRIDTIYNQPIDLATDGNHPGPAHNLLYAQRLIDILQKKD